MKKCEFVKKIKQQIDEEKGTVLRSHIIKRIYE